MVVVVMMMMMMMMMMMIIILHPWAARVCAVSPSPEGYRTGQAGLASLPLVYVHA